MVKPLPSTLVLPKKPSEARSTTTVEVQRTRRARLGTLNAGKEELLNFTLRRVAGEAPRVAARCWDLWQTTGSIPKQAGKFKVLNLPSAALGQGLWTQVAGQMKSWLSNAENQLRQEIRRYSAEQATVPVAPAQSRLDRAMFQAEFIGPRPKHSLYRRVKVAGKKAAIKAKRQQNEARWQGTLADEVQQALLIVQAQPGMAVQERRQAMWDAMEGPARRIDGLAQTPIERLVRALWLQVLDRCPQPSWRNMAWAISPNMGIIKLADGTEDLNHVVLKDPCGENDQRSVLDDVMSFASRNVSKHVKPSTQTLRSNGKRAKRTKKTKARALRSRPKATHHLILKLPEMSEWSAESDLILDWKSAVLEVEVYDTTSPAAVLHRQRRQDDLKTWREKCKTAEEQGQSLPEKPAYASIWSKNDQQLAESCLRAAGLSLEHAKAVLKGAQNQVVPSGRKTRVKLIEVALPLFAGQDSVNLPGVLANTVTLLKPRAKKHREEWQARLSYNVEAKDLQPSHHSKISFNPSVQPHGVLSMDAGVRVGMTTNVGLPGGPAAQRGVVLDPHGKAKPKGLALEHLLPNWGNALEPLIQAAWRTAAGCQAQGLPVNVGHHHQREQRLAGRVKNEMETVLKSLVCALRPAFIVIEDLDLRGGGLRKDTNRQVQRMGFGIARAWLERNAPVYGFTLHRENPAYTSQQCSSCWFIDQGNRNGGLFKCLRCNHEMDADRNAALNLQERFLFGEWLTTLDDDTKNALGLSQALIEGWMHPKRVKQSLEVREAFLNDDVAWLLASEHHKLPVALLVQAKQIQTTRGILAPQARSQEVVHGASHERSKWGLTRHLS